MHEEEFFLALKRLLNSCILPDILMRKNLQGIISSLVIDSSLRPPPNLLRQETEGTQIYLTVLNQTASQGVSNGGEAKYPNGSDKDGASKGEEEKLREESERRFVTFCGHILREVATLQPGPNEIVQAEAHRSLVLRSPVTVQVQPFISEYPFSFSMASGMHIKQCLKP